MTVEEDSIGSPPTEERDTCGELVDDKNVEGGELTTW